MMARSPMFGMVRMDVATLVALEMDRMYNNALKTRLKHGLEFSSNEYTDPPEHGFTVECVETGHQVSFGDAPAEDKIVVYLGETGEFTQEGALRNQDSVFVFSRRHIYHNDDTGIRAAARLALIFLITKDFGRLKHA